MKGADEYQRSKIEMTEGVDKQLRLQAYQVIAINIDDRIPNVHIREKVFELIPKADSQQFLKAFKKPNFDRDFYRWEYYGQQALTIKKNVRPLFKVLEFSCTDDKLAKAVMFLRQHLNAGKPFKDYDYQGVPLDFFPKALKKYLTHKVQLDGQTVKKVDGDRYECMVYHQLKNGMANTTVFIKDSHCYRAL